MPKRFRGEVTLKQGTMHVIETFYILGLILIIYHSIPYRLHIYKYTHTHIMSHEGFKCLPMKFILRTHAKFFAQQSELINYSLYYFSCLVGCALNFKPYAGYVLGYLSLSSWTILLLCFKSLSSCFQEITKKIKKKNYQVDQLTLVEETLFEF